VPLPVSVSAMNAVTIGGTSVRLYGCLSVTELDSHANMAVAGRHCTIISRSGHHATVTPFSADLPVMEQVNIDDVAIAYDDPYSSRTFLLVIRNALLISSMDHNLLPPFLVREASLFLDETPKFQSTDLTQDNHTIFDKETGMMIHLQLNGAFSYFPTQLLILDQQLNWDDYPVVGGTVERFFFGTFFCGEVKKNFAEKAKKAAGHGLTATPILSIICVRRPFPCPNLSNNFIPLLSELVISGNATAYRICGAMP
jgi:hypothetical protein